MRGKKNCAISFCAILERNLKERIMHVTGIITDNFQLLIFFKFMPNYEYSSDFIHAEKLAVAETTYIFA
jgi:hypothetical protein